MLKKRYLLDNDVEGGLNPNLFMYEIAEDVIYLTADMLTIIVLTPILKDEEDENYLEDLDTIDFEDNMQENICFNIVNRYNVQFILKKFNEVDKFLKEKDREFFDKLGGI